MKGIRMKGYSLSGRSLFLTLFLCYDYAWTGGVRIT